MLTALVQRNGVGFWEEKNLTGLARPADRCMVLAHSHHKPQTGCGKHVSGNTYATTGGSAPWTPHRRQLAESLAIGFGANAQRATAMVERTQLPLEKSPALKRGAPWTLPPKIALGHRLGSGMQLINPRGSLQAAATELPLYPGWLFGEWSLEVQPVAFAEPLGARFVDNVTRDAIRQDFGDKAKVLKWRSRFYSPTSEEFAAFAVSTDEETASSNAQFQPAVRADTSRRSIVGPDPVVQHRAFNAANEVRAFLGSDSPEVLTSADPRAVPMVVRIAFPIDDGESVQGIELSLDASSAESAEDNFISSELFRQTVSTNGEVESIGDFEVINAYQFVSDEIVRVKNRVVKYLVPGDELYKEAANIGVSLTDYDWIMRRVSTCIQTPYGRQCCQAV